MQPPLLSHSQPSTFGWENGPEGRLESELCQIPPLWPAGHSLTHSPQSSSGLEDRYSRVSCIWPGIGDRLRLHHRAVIWQGTSHWTVNPENQITTRVWIGKRKGNELVQWERGKDVACWWGRRNCWSVERRRGKMLRYRDGKVKEKEFGFGVIWINILGVVLWSCVCLILVRGLISIHLSKSKWLPLLTPIFGYDLKGIKMNLTSEFAEWSYLFIVKSNSSMWPRELF